MGGDHRLDEQAAGTGGGTGRGALASQVRHHRGTAAVAQRLGVVAGGGGPDRVLLADGVGARPHRDRSVRRRLLPLQVQQRRSCRLGLSCGSEALGVRDSDGIGRRLQRRWDLGGGEGIGCGIAGEGVATAGVLGGDQLGERGLASRRPAGRLRVLPGGDQGLEDQRGRVGIGAGAGLVREAAVTVLLGVQPGQGRGIATARPRGVERHEHHRPSSWCRWCRSWWQPLGSSLMSR